MYYCGNQKFQAAESEDDDNNTVSLLPRQHISACNPLILLQNTINFTLEVQSGNKINFLALTIKKRRIFLQFYIRLTVTREVCW